MNSYGKISKKILVWGAGLFGALVLILAIIPFFIDVDSYRPKIVSIANEHINGKLELGKLSLSLWGQIRVNVDGMTLKDAHDQKVMGVKDVYFHLPFFSLFSGSPILTFKTTKPELFIVKNKAGKMNVMTLIKEEPKAQGASAKPAEATDKTAKGSAPSELPSIVKNARLGVEMKKAQLSYKDEASGLVSQVNDLNLLAKDISLSKKMEVIVTADLDTKMGKTLEVKGPARMTLNAFPKFKGAEFESSDITIKGDMDGVEIHMPGTFEKKKGLAANVTANLTATPDSVQIKDCTAKFHNAVIETQGGASGFSSNALKYDFTVKSNEIDLKAWNELLPALNMKADAKMMASAKIVTDAVENFTVSMKAPGNEGKVVGKVVSFTKPKIDMALTSSGMDLDQIIDFSKMTAEAPKGKAAPESKGGGGGEAGAGKGGAASGTAHAEEDFDALLEPLRTDPMAKDMVFNGKVQIAFIKAKNVRISDIGVNASFKGLALNVDGAHLNVFGGNIKAGMAANLAPKTPTYKMNLNVDKLDIQKAVESQFAMFKNTLIGIASFRMDGQGASFNPTPAKKNLNASGHFQAENATFATIDIGKVVVEAIGKSLDGIAQKVPALKGKSLGAPPNIDSKYTIVSSDFTISGGRFNAPNFVAKAVQNKGLDLKGDTKVGLVDLGLDANWEIVDTYNLTKARDLNVDFQGVHVEHILADNDGNVHIPIKVGGTCAAPQVSYTAVPEALGKVAVNNSTKALGGKAKAEAKKKIEEAVQKQAPPQVQEALKKFGGKLFGN